VRQKPKIRPKVFCGHLWTLFLWTSVVSQICPFLGLHRGPVGSCGALWTLFRGIFAYCWVGCGT